MNRLHALQRTFLLLRSTTTAQRGATIRCFTCRRAPQIEYTRRVFCCSASALQQKTGGNSPTSSTTGDRGRTAKKSLKSSPKITLIAPNQNVSVTSLEEAQKLAKRRDLRLIQVQQLDTKTMRPTYKLVTSAELLAEELEGDAKSNEGFTGVEAREKSAQKRSEKSLTIGARMSEHDLASRLKNIAKWLVKQHEVRILIQGNASDMASAEKIFKTIEESLEKTGKIVQKRAKGGVIKFNIVAAASTAPSSDSNKTDGPA